MIIWSGFGFLVAVFVFGCSLAANLIVNSTTGGEAYWELHRWPIGLALVAAAIPCWTVGRMLYRRGERILFDIQTGEQVIHTPSHTLFFIPMPWWGPILAALGLLVMVRDLAG